MSDAFILSACRTPIGKFRGSLSSLPVTELGAIAVREAVARAGVEPADIDEVILGNVLSAGVGQAPARQAALRAGLPPTVAALTVNKVCGSGLKAVMLAAQGVRCGDVDLVVAGGMESMSQAGWVLPRDAPALGDRALIDSMMHDGLTCPFSKQSMGEIADDLAARAGISRDEQDRYRAGESSPSGRGRRSRRLRRGDRSSSRAARSPTNRSSRAMKVRAATRVSSDSRD